MMMKNNYKIQCNCGIIFDDMRVWKRHSMKLNHTTYTIVTKLDLIMQIQKATIGLTTFPPEVHA